MMDQLHKSRTKYVLFRVAAITLGLLPFVVFEIGLNLVGWNETNELVDPYVGFGEVRPLFVLNEDAGRYEVSTTRYPLFRPEEFSAKKKENEFRIFCLGGSTVQGRPYAIETSFTTWLELSLKAAAPDRKWDVVNCGGVSYASYRLVPILKEVLNYQPDLIVLYTGHNEFLEDRTYESIKQNPGWVNETHEILSRLNTYRFVRHLVSSSTAGSSLTDRRQVLSADVQAELDFRNGLEFYHRDEAWRTDVIKHFAFNLKRMVKLTKKANVPLVLVNPVSNLKDCVPFKSEHRAGTSKLVCKQISDLEQDPSTVNFDSVEHEFEHIQELLNADDQYAALSFRAGHCLLALNRVEEAKQAFINAKELDVCPLRILEPMHDVIHQAATEYQIPLVDVREFFENRAADGLPGRDWLVDHVHPSIHGHQLIAGLLVDTMRELGFVRVSNENWRADRDTSFDKHLASLDFLYFQLGKDRLRGLQRWTRGETKKERPK